MTITQRLTDVPNLSTVPGFALAVAATGQVAFLSGQVATDADGKLVGAGDMGAQTRQALLNLEKVLTSLGAGWADVLKLTWFVTDAGQVQAVRDARDEVLRPALGELPNPASSLVQVAALFQPEFLIEVEAVVAVPASGA